MATQPGTPPMPVRIRKVSQVILVAGVLIFLIWIGFPKAFTGDFADVTIKAVTSTPAGKVTVRIASVASYGTPVSIQLFKNQQYVSGTRDESTGAILRRPVSRERTVSFNLNPEAAASAGRFEDTPLFKRLLVQPGRIYHLSGEQTMTLFDFEVNGARYTGFIRIGKSLSGI